MPNNLEQEIKDLEQELKLKKLMKREFEKSQKQQFVETKAGKKLFQLLQAFNEPFVKWHQEATLALENPIEYKASKLHIKAREVLEKCNKIKQEDKDSKLMAVLAAEKVMELESISGDPLLIESLDKEVQRLRPPKNEEKMKAIEEMFSKLMAGQNGGVKF